MKRRGCPVAIFTPEERIYFSGFMSRDGAGAEFLIGLTNHETEAFLDYRRGALRGATACLGLIEHMALHAKHDHAVQNLFEI